MKKVFLIVFFSLFIIFLNFTINSCSPEEKIIEKQMIQISDEELIEKNSAIYKTREINGKERKFLSSDFSRIEKPSSLDEFTQYFHNPPLRQHRTGTCWSFATTSFLESELKRLEKGEVKLSEIYTVYWEYVEKARGFIKQKGKQSLGQGSEHNAVTERMKKYGAVPASAYSGLLPGQEEHNHSKLFREIRNYLTFCKENKYWDEEKAISYVKSILNKHLGTPPETIEVDGKSMTPKEYLENVLQLPLDDYVCFMSLKSLPFYTKGEYKVPDNWWHSEEYYNVPLDEFFDAIVNSLKNRYTVALGGDVSEPGISSAEDIAIVPTYDILQKLIDQDSREFRFYNRTSTDDHAIHAVGFKEMGDRTWFLIKDSGGGAHRGQFKGYYFYRDDYIKLKMLTLMVHKDAVSNLLDKFKENE
ncbi:MAG: peptidase C1 [Candidatus Aminicenantes bacterium]|nr:peptidase C1 [Candidatus Aminicenantes bacterium]